MRRLLIALTVALIPSFAIAHGHGGGGGGRMGGGWGRPQRGIDCRRRSHGRMDRTYGCLERWPYGGLEWSCRQLEPLSSRPLRAPPRTGFLRRRALVGRLRILRQWLLAVDPDSRGSPTDLGLRQLLLDRLVCRELLMSAERDQRTSARSFWLRFTRSSRLSPFGRREAALLSSL
jgi:hypothetical protein